MVRVVILLSFFVFMTIPEYTWALGTPPERMHSLRTLAAGQGFSKPEASGKSVTVRRPDTTMIFTLGSRKLIFNDILVLLNAPMVKRKRHYYLATVDMDGTLIPLLKGPGAVFGARGIKRVLLDPGHGGEDSGAVSNGNLEEKTIVLDVARRTCSSLRSCGIEAMLTRSIDAAVSLDKRPEMAASCGADLFVSIHMNSSHNPTASGVETYVMPSAGFPSTASGNHAAEYCPGNRFDAVNIALAYSLHREVLEHTRAADRGIRRARYAVLRNAPCPAILLECGFLSNREEESLIAKAEYRQAIAEGIAAGICRLMRSR